MPDNIWYLKNCELFEQLTPDQLKKLELRSRSRLFKRGDPIYIPADQADGVLLLTSGRVKICSITDEGKQAILAFIDPGEIFGELSLLAPGQAREEYAEALEKTTVILISRTMMQELIEQHPLLSLGITKLFGLRRQRIERRLKYLLFRSNRERLTHLLLELATQYGKRTTNGIELQVKLSHQDLASVIGSTRETITVQLNKLQAEGVVLIARRRITITALERLANSVHVEVPQIT